MLLAVGEGKAAHVTLEIAGEGTVIVKAAFERDLGDGFSGLAELIRCDQNPQANDIRARADAEALLEEAFELALRQSGLFREFRNREAGCVIFLDVADHFYHGIIAVFLGSLVVLNDAAHAFHLAVSIEERVFASGEPFGQSIPSGEELDQVEQWFTRLDHDLIVSAEFLGHVMGKDIVVEFPVQSLDGRDSAVFEEAVISHEKSAFLVLHEEHKIGDMFEESIQLASLIEIRKPIKR